MIQTFEDVIELSLDLNNKTYPYLKGLQRFFHDNPDENPEAKEGVDEVLVELDYLFAFLYQNLDQSTGKYDFSGLPDRDYH